MSIESILMERIVNDLLFQFVISNYDGAYLHGGSRSYIPLILKLLRQRRVDVISMEFAYFSRLQDLSSYKGRKILVHDPLGIEPNVDDKKLLEKLYKVSTAWLDDEVTDEFDDDFSRRLEES